MLKCLLQAVDLANRGSTAAAEPQVDKKINKGIIIVIIVVLAILMLNTAMFILDYFV